MISTLASHKRSKVLEQANSDSSDSCLLALEAGESDNPAQQGACDTPYLPSAPTSPIPTTFPFPPVNECPLAIAAKTPGSARQPFFSCPNPQDCTPRTPNIPVPQPLSREVGQDQFQTLSWDNYSETPEFYNPSQRSWSEYPELDKTFLLSSPGESLASSTNPFHLDVSLPSSELGLEGLRGDTEPVHKVQLVSTDCSDLPDYSPSLPELLRAESFEEEEYLSSHSDPVATMDNAEAGKLVALGKELEDELDDLVPSDMTRLKHYM